SRRSHRNGFLPARAASRLAARRQGAPAGSLLYQPSRISADDRTSVRRGPPAARRRAAPLNAIEVRQLEKRFGAVCELAGVSLAIGQGEFFGLLGPNGAGKTNLLNVIAGLARPDYGAASDIGHDVVDGLRHA